MIREDILALQREVDYWQRRHDQLLRMLMDQSHLRPVAPRMLADAESFNAGKAMAFNEAEYSISIETNHPRMNLVMVYRSVPGQPTTLVASQRLPEVKP